MGQDTSILKDKRRSIDVDLVFASTDDVSDQLETQTILDRFDSCFKKIRLVKCVEELEAFITHGQERDIFIITSTSVGQELVPKIHSNKWVHSIIVYRQGDSLQETWTQKWGKVLGIYNTYHDLLRILGALIEYYGRSSIGVNRVNIIENSNSETTDKLAASFIYSKFLKQILMEIRFEPADIQRSLESLRRTSANSKESLVIIDKFSQNYNSNKALWWYTHEYMVEDLVNRSLQMLNADVIVDMGFFVCDLHRHIQQQHQKQIVDSHKNQFIVYHGENLSESDFDKLKHAKGSLLGFNCFLLTNENRLITTDFVRYFSRKSNMIGIVFVMTIDPQLSNHVPFINIVRSDNLNVTETLFSTHTVFRVGEMKALDDSSRLYEVQLELTTNTDIQGEHLLRFMTQRVHGNGWMKLASLLLDLGHLNKAEEIYIYLLKKVTEEREQAVLYDTLGLIYHRKGNHANAIRHYEKSIHIYKRITSSDDINLATVYTRIGHTYQDMHQYTKALGFYDEALDIQRKVLPENNSNLVTSYSNLGEIHYLIDDYAKAIPYFKKALDIQKKILPENHQDFVNSYKNLGKTHYALKEYTNTLALYQRALDIQKKLLSENHATLSSSYSDIGEVYFAMGNCRQALIYFQNALEIQKISMPENHPYLATSLENLAHIHRCLQENDKALELLKAALKIRLTSSPETHSSVKNVRKLIEEVQEAIKT